MHIRLNDASAADALAADALAADALAADALAAVGPSCCWRFRCCPTSSCCKYLVEAVEAVEPARNTGYPDINTNISFCINTIG
jgi:hypothetical protein